MEAVEHFDHSDCSDRHKQNLSGCKNKNNTEIVNKNFVTEKDILQWFGSNEEYFKYYVSLKEAVMENRKNGGVCWCDPQDSVMKERLEVSKWRPKVVLKLPCDLASSEREECGISSKQIALDIAGQNEDVEDKANKDTKQGNVGGTENELNNESFRCGLHGCNQRFNSLANYESHYHTYHNHVCATCKSSFISEFLLDIHLQENHDSYFQILCPRIDMFRCLVESCQLKFRTSEVRTEHLVTVHRLPANFMFHKPVKTKVKKSKSTSKSASSTHFVENNIVDSSLISSLSEPSHSMEVDVGDQSLPTGGGATENIRRGVTSSHRTGKRVPPTICFGRGSRRSFQNRQPRGNIRHWHQTGSADMDTAVNIENVDFADMIDSLESV